MAEKEILKVTEAEYIAMFFGHKGKPVETIEVEPVGKVEDVKPKTEKPKAEVVTEDKEV